MKFKKMHGLGNDFVIVDCRGGQELPSREVIGKLSDRKLGIGYDQFIPLLPAKDERADVYMQILNAPSATEAQACGNATRCVADLLMHEKGEERVVIQTIAGLLECWRESDGHITADMGAPGLGWKDIPISKELDTLHLRIGEGEAQDPVGVNVGNPHAVFFIESDVENFQVHELGPRFEHDPLFPEKANIEFVNVIDRQNMRMRVWERDTGETDACGSAACATAIAGVRRGLIDRKCTVHLNGGPLQFHWREQDDHILMTGPATHVYDGEIAV